MLASAQHPDANPLAIEDIQEVPKSITKECIMTTREYGPNDALLTDFDSNMDDVVETL